VVVVSNSSPLIYLAALSDFGMLQRLFGTIQIPPAVWSEIVDQGAGLPGREAARQAAAEGWLQITALRAPAEPIKSSGRTLHLGETEVIRLAEQLRADVLLMDDRLAVIYARSRGFRVAPTIAIYIEAKRRRLLHSVKERVDHLRAAGFRLTDADYRAVLAAAGEL
jgi:predicted nucleic acid-binding protein